jgi:hypothetical protein
MIRGPMPRCPECRGVEKRLYMYDGRQGQRRWVLIANYCPSCRTCEVIP